MELLKDTRNRNLGLMEHECRICGAKGRFQSYLVREMMKGTRDEFEYFVCPECICLQIAEIPENLGDYYGNEYYSMQYKNAPDKEFSTPVKDSSKILDMGCGIGAWLYEMAKEGYDNLYGCDPYLENDIEYGDRVNIKKCDISLIDGDGTFDLIRMGDSFEHVTNPKEVLENAKRLISDSGAIAMSLPIYPNIAFDMYETHWYQLDAPRHIFLHSIISLKYLADKCGLKITKVVFDSDTSQLIYSFFYQHGVTYNEITTELCLKYFKPEELFKIDDVAKKANENKNGDHAIVYMRKADY